MKGKGSDFWDAVIWSDETSVATMPKGKEALYWVHQSTEREDFPVDGQIVDGGFSIMFWGCFSKMGLGALVALEGSQNRKLNPPTQWQLRTRESSLIRFLVRVSLKFHTKIIFKCRPMYLTP